MRSASLHSSSRYDFAPVDDRVQLVRERLDKEGFVQVEADFVTVPSGDIGVARKAFLASSRENPIDPHCTVGERRRRYGVFILHPWSGVLESLPPIWDPTGSVWIARYLQAASLNPEHPGEGRAFAPLTPDQRTNLFLRATIARCFSALPLKEVSQPILVGVHIIQLVARPGAPGVSSPDVLHRDGEPWTWAFLLDRHNVDGGENVIAHPDVANKHPMEVSDQQIITRFTLVDPFEGWVVNDRRVSHYVSPVTVIRDKGIGWRTILLIDFTPAIPDVPK